MPTAASPASPPAPTPTQTGYTLLGLLSFGRELSGYELKQWADNLRFFWSAPAMSQVYRELERLAAAGLVVQRSVVREGTRATKVYRLSAGGRDGGAGLAGHPARPAGAAPPGGAAGVLRAPARPRPSCGRPSSRTGRGATTCWPSWGGAQRAGRRRRWRNAALVAEWGLDYYRGERAAVERHRATP